MDPDPGDPKTPDPTGSGSTVPWYSGHETALGMVRSALEKGREIHLYACETRPYNQVVEVVEVVLEFKRTVELIHVVREGVKNYFLRPRPQGA